jgi:hypothetical protein
VIHLISQFLDLSQIFFPWAKNLLIILKALTKFGHQGRKGRRGVMLGRINSFAQQILAQNSFDQISDALNLWMIIQLIH